MGCTEGLFNLFKGSADPDGPDYRCLKFRHCPSVLIALGCVLIAASYYLREEYMLELFEGLIEEVDINLETYPYRTHDRNKFIPNIGTSYVTFWNITNPEEFALGAKPAVEKVGPFAFDVTHRNLRGVFNDDVSEGFLYLKYYYTFNRRKSSASLPPEGLDTEIFTINEPYAFFLGAAGYSEIAMTATLLPSLIQEVLARLADKYGDDDADRAMARFADCGESLGLSCDNDASVMLYDKYPLEVPELCAWVLSVGLTTASCVPPAILSAILHQSLALFQPYLVQQQAVAAFFATLLGSPATLITEFGITPDQLTGLGGYLEYLQTGVAIPMFTELTVMSNNGLVVKRTAHELIFGWIQPFSADVNIGANFNHIPLYNSDDCMHENLTEWWRDEANKEATFLGLFPDRSYVDPISTGNGGRLEWRFSQLRFDGKFDIQYGNGSIDLSASPVYRYQGQQPFNTDHGDRRIFQVNTVRPILFEFERAKWDDVIGIIRVDRYKLSNSALETCATEEWNCVYPDHYHGFFNMTTLYLGAPLYFSLPHFSGSEEEWIPQCFDDPGVFEPDLEKYRWFVEADFFTGLSVEGYVGLQRNLALRPTDLYYPTLFLCDNCTDLMMPTLIFEEETIQFQLLLNSVYTLQFIKRFSQYSTQVTSVVLAAIFFLSVAYIYYKRRKGRSDWETYDQQAERRKAYETPIPTAMMDEFGDHLKAQSRTERRMSTALSGANAAEGAAAEPSGSDELKPARKPSVIAGDKAAEDDDEDYDDMHHQFPLELKPRRRSASEKAKDRKSE